MPNKVIASWFLHNLSSTPLLSPPSGLIEANHIFSKHKFLILNSHSLILTSAEISSFFFFFRPLSMSENLSKLAHKINFFKDESEEKGKPTSEGERETDEEKVLAPFQPSLWPWDSVRNKLK